MVGVRIFFYSKFFFFYFVSSRLRIITNEYSGTCTKFLFKIVRSKCSALHFCSLEIQRHEVQKTQDFFFVMPYLSALGLARGSFSVFTMVSGSKSIVDHLGHMILLILFGILVHKYDKVYIFSHYVLIHINIYKYMLGLFISAWDRSR